MEEYLPKYKKTEKYETTASTVLSEMQGEGLELLVRSPKKGFLKGHLADSPCN